MENKYFYPEISDIRVGYECEIKTLQDDKIDWLPITIDIDGDVNSDLNICLLKLINDMLRTPYLTKKQIEAEGWETRLDGYFFIKDCDDYVLSIHKYPNNIIHIERFNLPEYRNTNYDTFHDLEGKGVGLFFGECKDINTFKYISKLLKLGNVQV